MNLEALAVHRADEQLERGAWKRADRGESDGPRLCPKCEQPILRRGAGVCTACHEEGWRGTPCVTCGNVTHKRDRSAVRKRFYGMCGECRRVAREAA
jgi:hypothetical protein